jgi:hypothetical protein
VPVPLHPSQFTSSMIVVALLLVLFTCWSLWGLSVGESCNIRWIRHWCGAIFVIMVGLLSAGSGFLVARVMERSSARENTFEALQAIADRVEAGDHDAVIRSIRALDHRDDPDADAYDLLDELPEFASQMHQDLRTTRTAANDAGFAGH